MSAVVRVDLAALRANLRAVRERVAPAEHMLVVKDDAYGHGIDAVVRTAYDAGGRWFGAFDVPTALAVRAAAGESVRIFVWLLAGRGDVAAAAAADLDLGIGDRQLLDDAARIGGDGTRVHLKIDSGLHRNGIRPEEWEDAVDAAARYERAGLLRVEGVWTHLAEASDGEDDEARSVFFHARAAAEDAGLTPSLSHLAASAAAFTRPEFREDLVRVGAFAYGIPPAGGPDETQLGIVPIASVIASVRDVDGAHATLSVGALDGVPAALGGLISVRTPAGVRRVVAIRPDRTIVETWPGARVGEEIVLLGAGAVHGFTDAAERIGTIGEEIAVRLSPLLRREYVGE